MQKAKLTAISLLTSSLLLASCVGSSGGSTSEEESNSVDPDSISSEYGEFHIVSEDGSPAPVFNSASSTYSFEVGAAKASYAISGFFEGSFVINNTAALEEFKGVTFHLNGAYLTNLDAGASVIAYNALGKSLTVECAADTENFLSSDGVALLSENNLYLGGDGALTVSSVSNHALRGDSVYIYDELSLSIAAAGKDGLHGKHFHSDNGAETVADLLTHQGTISVKNVDKQAFDFSDANEWVGTIDLGSTTAVTIDGCENAFKSDLTIDLKGSVSAIGIEEDPIVRDKDNAGTLTVHVTGNVSFNQNVLAKNTYTY